MGQRASKQAMRFAGARKGNPRATAAVLELYRSIRTRRFFFGPVQNDGNNLGIKLLVPGEAVGHFVHFHIPGSAGMHAIHNVCNRGTVGPTHYRVFRGSNDQHRSIHVLPVRFGVLQGVPGAKVCCAGARHGGIKTTPKKAAVTLASRTNLLRATENREVLLPSDVSVIRKRAGLVSSDRRGFSRSLRERRRQWSFRLDAAPAHGPATHGLPHRTEEHHVH